MSSILKNRIFAQTRTLRCSSTIQIISKSSWIFKFGFRCETSVDSTIALAWIACEPNRWHTFVANRTAEIQRLSADAKWHHIRSEQNPTDVLSWGIDLDEIQYHKLWWNGPHFLQEDYNERLNDSQQPLNIEELSEAKKQVVTLHAVQNEEPSFINKFSSLSHLKRTIAYCLRFIHNSKANSTRKVSKFNGPLQSNELEHSKRVLLAIAQSEEFSEKIAALSRKKEISSKSKILSLRPFLDENNLLRIGGRLQGSQLDYQQKHAIIIPRNHHITLIIREAHLKNLHAGAQTLLAIIRTQYWPISGKNAVKGILRKCIVCYRASATPAEQLMGNLPASRITPSPPF